LSSIYAFAKEEEAAVLISPVLGIAAAKQTEEPSVTTTHTEQSKEEAKNLKIFMIINN
jgi:hypothetical protein